MATENKLQDTLSFLAIYSLVGAFSFAINAASFTLLHTHGVAVSFATGIAFLIGGQVSFVCHDRLTFGGRVVHYDRWQKRWRLMMVGQAMGFLVNWAVSNTLVQTADMPTWLVYLAATFSGAAVTCCWANCYSHKKGQTFDPAEPAEVLTHV